MKNKISVIIILCLCVITCGCNKKLSLTSNDWIYKNGTAVYHFDKNGTGIYSLKEGEEIEFTYVDNKTSVEIIYKGIKTPVKLKYEIKDGELNIDDSFGNYEIYVKKK